MTCEEIRDLLDRHAAGTLPPAMRREVERHLEACQVCRAEAALVGPVLAGVARLPRSIEPPRDLWPAVAARIREKKTVVPGFGGAPRTPWWARPAALAAAAVLLVVLSSAVTSMVMRRVGGGGPGIGPAPGAATLPGDFLALEAQYAGAAQEIVAALREGRVKVSPETRRVLERNLRIIDDAIRESREALKGDPANRELRDMILSTYRHKLDLLRRATAQGAA